MAHSAWTRSRTCLALLLTLAACGKPATPRADNGVRGQQNADVTEVPDESGDDNASGNNSVDPD